MAKVQQKSSLAGKLGTAGRKAVEAHKDDDTEFDTGGRLPAGLEDVVCQLTKCYFAQYDKGANKGEYYFRASGVVVAPSEVTVDPNGRVADKGVKKKIEGMQTSIMEAMCDTPNQKSRPTTEDHMAWVLNEMRKLGADTKDVSVDDLEELAQSLEEEAPYFRMRTWKGEPTKQYPNPFLNEVWQGQVDFEASDADATQEVVDESGEVEEQNEEATEEEGGEEEVDLEALGSAADQEDEDSMATLTELATEHSLDPNEYETWAELAAVLSEAMGGGEEEAAEEEPAEEVVPEKGEVWDYVNPKTKKKVNVEITAVFPKNKTVNAKNLEDNKSVYKAIPWDKLSS